MASKAQKRQQRNDRIKRRFEEVQGLRPPATPKSQPIKILDESILKLQDFGLTYGVAYPLWRKYGTVKKLVEATEDEILEIHGIGPAKLDLLIDVLARLKLSLSK